MIRQLQAELRKVAEAAYDLQVRKLVNKLSQATPVDTGRAAAGWRLKNNVIVNDTPYISELNHGSSQQAPSFFIEKTVLSSPSLKPKGTIVTYR